MRGEGILFLLLALLVIAEQAQGQKETCCNARGDPHITGNDGGPTVHFQGVCTYNLVSDPNGVFSVWIETENRRGNTRVSWTKLVIIKCTGKQYKLTSWSVVAGTNEIAVNNNFQPIIDGNVRIEKVGNKVVLTIENVGVRVTWNRRSYVEVCLGPQWLNSTGLVNGLCGNNNGDPADDLTTSYGVLVGANMEGFRTFGDSWNVTQCQGVTPLGPHCTRKLMDAAALWNNCGQITDASGPFADCLNELGYTDYYNACEYDICATDDDTIATREIVCEHLQALQIMCEAAGFEIGNWWDVAGCESDGEPKPQPGTCCYVSGDPHIGQNDGGKRVHYQGVCTYNLVSAKDGTFSVWIETENKWGRTKVSWVKLVIINYRGMQYKLTNTSMWVGTYEITVRYGLPDVVNGDLRIEQVAKRMVLTIKSKGVTLTWNRRSYVQVCLGPEMYDSGAGLVEGLCGNNNGDPSDDLTTSYGVQVPSDREGFREFGDSWNVVQCEGQTPLGPDCTLEMIDEAALWNRCGQINDTTGPFADCLVTLGFSEYYEACEYDICGVYDDQVAMADVVCEQLQALQYECETEGFFVGYWWDDAGCDSGGEPLPVSTTTTQAQTTTTSSTRAPQTTTAPSQQWGRCSIRLDPHGKTPDGQIFQVNDVCTYDLAVATNGDFSVGMQTYRRNIIDERRAISFVKKIMISHNGDNFDMFPNALSVNGNAVTLPYNDLNLSCSFGEYKLCCDSKTSPFKFCSDRKFSFYLYFGIAYQSKLKGLCGNFNGSATDDYILRDGTDVGDQSNAMEVFVDDWKSSNC